MESIFGADFWIVCHGCKISWKTVPQPWDSSRETSVPEVVVATIGVASYGAVGYVSPRLPTVYFSGVTSEVQGRTNSDIRLHVVAYLVKQYTGL